AAALVGLDHDHRARQGRSYDVRVAPLARLLGEQLGVREPGDLTGLARLEDRRPRDQRPGARPAPRLVDAGDHPHPRAPQRALVAVQPGVAPDGRAEGQAAHWPPREGAGLGWPGAGIVAKSDGRRKTWNRSGGHSSTKTLPTTSLTGT